ncbi:MAG: hypothetical protein H6682_13170 [Candidatus Eisenbacteria bacterium]|nr:hypothetical protein [Candidatus Eisenbacteria bacterium]
MRTNPAFVAWLSACLVASAVSSAQAECAVMMNGDGSYETGYQWEGIDVQPPYFGAFAECFSGTGSVCGVVLDLTCNGDNIPFLDIYVWQDDGGAPGPVVAVSTGHDPAPVDFWPSVSRHAFPLEYAVSVGGTWWAGFWGDWPGATSSWFVGADSSGGDSGCPVTNVAPGLEWPAGWQPVPLVFGETTALGIGVEFEEGATPVRSRSWGEIKRVFR